MMTNIKTITTIRLTPDEVREAIQDYIYSKGGPLDNNFPRFDFVDSDSGTGVAVVYESK